MRWVTHQTVGVLAALACGLENPAIAAAWPGSVLPDIIDQQRARLRRNTQKRFNQIHRGASHWFGWYVLLLLGGLVVPLTPLARQITVGLALGALSHILLDMLTPSGIPLHPFSRQRKLSLKLCKTGGWGERIFLALALVAFWIFSGDYLALFISRLSLWVNAL